MQGLLPFICNYNGVDYCLTIEKGSPNSANTALTSPATTESKSTSSTPDMVQPSLPLATASQPVTGSPSAVKTEKTSRQMEQLGTKSENKEIYEACESDKKDEEPNMEHFAKAAENLVMSLDDEVNYTTLPHPTFSPCFCCI